MKLTDFREEEEVRGIAVENVTTTEYAIHE